tara:strand:- start:294 stop:608 length:315 start_codon:yes stop_codon:yes gene_type:complete
MIGNIILDKNFLSTILFGFVLGYSINYYNIKNLENIIARLEIVETRNLFLKEDIDDLKIKIFEHKNLIKELDDKQESMILMKKKKRNKINVQYEDVDFGIRTPE